MKPIFKSLLLFCVISLTVACSKDDNKEEISADNDSYVKLFSGKQFDLSGTWKMSKRLLSPDSEWIPVPDNDATTYTFTKDGKYTMKRSPLEVSGTYTLQALMSEDVFLGVKLTLYTLGDVNIELRLDVQDDGVFRMDQWNYWYGTDYISHIYNKTN